MLPNNFKKVVQMFFFLEFFKQCAFLLLNPVYIHANVQQIDCIEVSSELQEVQNLQDWIADTVYQKLNLL